MIRAIDKTKAIIILLLILCSSSQVFATEDLTFSAEAPKSVEMGKQFEVAFTINTTSVNDFRAPSFDNFDVLIGPSRGVKSYSSYVNGKTTNVNSLTYTYILMPKAEGKFTISSAAVSVKGKNLNTKPLTINVLPSGSDAATSSSRNGQGIRKDDIFIVGTLSKAKPYEQEAVVLTYKIYVASVSLSGIRPSKLPEFNGFHSQEIDIANKDRWDLEHYKGRNYRTAILRQIVLFPQRSGNLTIEPIDYEVAIEQPQEMDFDSFFNMSMSNTVRKIISSPKITVNVSPLPQGKPSTFGGGVGRLNITSSISANTIKANEALTIKIVISGTGNLKLISNPILDIPTDFEVYDPKVEDQITISEQGNIGNRVIEYLIIPRHEGNYTIPASSYSYFDVQSKSYKTLKTQAFNIAVAKGENSGTSSPGAIVGNYTNKEDLKLLAEDIRFIKMNDVELHSRTEFVKGSLTYRLFFIIPSVLVILFLLANIKRAKENSNIALVRTKKANKVAKSRMKNAEKLLKAGNKDLFYDEVLRALWGYISDKLTIPVSKLSKDNIEEELNKYGVDAVLKTEFINTLNECEFAKFAPGADNLAMDKLFNDATDIIGRMENSIKH